MSCNNSVSLFCQLMFSSFFAPHILQPSRIANHSKTLIDNIFLNTIDYKTSSGNFENQISDHLIQFLVLENFYHQKTQNPSYSYRDFRFFNHDEFQNELLLLNLDFTQNLNVDESFNKFYDSILFLFDEHAPLRTHTKKELSLKTKPWIDNSIKNAMKIRDMLFRKYRRSKSEVLRNRVFNEYKSQRNKVIFLAKKSKNNYYKNYFSKFKNNISKTWMGIKKVISCKKSNCSSNNITLNHEGAITTDLDKIVNIFNNFFVSVGSKIAEKIPAAEKSFTSFLKNINVSESLYLSPTSSCEIAKIIKSLDNSKALGPNSFPVKLLKFNVDILCEPISKIVNLCFDIGKFPIALKVVKSYLYLKREITLFVVIIAPYLCYQYSVR